MALCFQFLDPSNLFSGLQSALPVGDSELSRHRRDGVRTVAGQDDELEPALAQRSDHRDRIRPQSLPNGDAGYHAAMREADEGCISAAACLRGGIVGGNAAEAGAAKTRFGAVD